MSINFRIVSFDPGGTTGWATWSAQKISTLYYGNVDIEYYGSQFNCGMLNWDQHHESLYDFMGNQRVTETIYITESFEFRNRHRDNVELVSREYIGIMKLFAFQNGVKLVQQTASEGKITLGSFVKKENLKRLDLWRPSAIHAMDALGHLIYYMIKNGICSEELLNKAWR